MKKNNYPFCFGVICCCFMCCSVSDIFAQNKIIVTGTVVKSVSNTPLGAAVIKVVSRPAVFTYSDKMGRFILEFASNATFEIQISFEDYISQSIVVSELDRNNIHLGTISMLEKQDVLIYSNTLELSEDDLLDNDIGGANVITGLLQSSKDVFIRTAAFNFGQARFKIRGYDSREGIVLFNGIKMNKVNTGRPNWSNWGGLNDVLRNLEFSNGIAPSPVSFGSVLGVTNFQTRASEYRPGSSLSLAASNGSYKGRIMASHFSGLLKNDWAFAFSLSSRFANEGAVEGTTYKSYSAFLSVEKKININHSLNFTGIYAFNKRGKSSANTQEVIELKGGRYNSYWGIQENQIRNSRVLEVTEPIVMLEHNWKVDNTLINSSVAYQFGYVGASRLGYANVNSPDPSYYKYLPSYALANQDFSEAYKLTERFEEDGQINWSDLYELNDLTNTSSYYLYEDRNEDQQLSFRSVLNKKVSPKLIFDMGFGVKSLESFNYALLTDPLGEKGFVDVDSFETGDAAQSDLKNRNRSVTTGDQFSYNYKIHFTEVELFFQTSYKMKKFELVGAASYHKNSFQRTGFYKNGKYPNTSYGEGTKKYFNNISLKFNGLYKFSGRHLLYGNIALISRAPVLNNVYSNVRISNEFTFGLENENIRTVDVSYQYRAPKMKSRFTVYHTGFFNGVENSFVFAEGLRGDNSDFIVQSVSNIEKKHFGLEYGSEIELSSRFALSVVVALGQYTYNNNPNLYVESDLFQEGDGNFGTVYLKNYKIGGTPQRAYSIGLSYRDPEYWWIAVNGNLLTHHYLSISPLLRTNNFFQDGDGLPFINDTTGNEVSQKEISKLLQQERFDDLFLVNLVGGKSWKLKESYVGLFVSVNNILGTFYKTGGFEQARKANYQELLEDKELSKPLFGSKYWVQNGTSYFVILSYRF